MKQIGNIFLTWKKGPGSRRIAVAKIARSATDIGRFHYLPENVEIAKKEGFSFYTGFPDTNKVYTENVLDILGQRISKSERNDLKDFYDFWCVDSSRKNDVFYMLAMTQGLLPTDNFEFLADFNPVKDLVFISEISGLSVSKLSPDLIKIGDKLSFNREPDNEYDDKAVELFFNGIKLGYVKAIHSNVFYKTRKNPLITIHHLERNGVIKRAFIKIHF
jgi:hypothetical protein